MLAPMPSDTSIDSVGFSSQVLRHSAVMGRRQGKAVRIFLVLFELSGGGNVRMTSQVLRRSALKATFLFAWAQEEWGAVGGE